MGFVEYDLTDPVPMSGSAYAVSSDAPPDDPVEALRRVVEEVTGTPLPRTTPRIGFL